MISSFLVFAGTFDIIVAISARREIRGVVAAIGRRHIELALGFWAAGYYGRSAVLLVAWVAAFALIRGVRDVVLAGSRVELRHVQLRHQLGGGVELGGLRSVAEIAGGTPGISGSGGGTAGTLTLSGGLTLQGGSASTFADSPNQSTFSIRRSTIA